MSKPTDQPPAALAAPTGSGPRCDRLTPQLEACGKPALFRDPHGCPMCEEHAAKWLEWFPGSAYYIRSERPDPHGWALVKRVVAHHFQAKVMRTVMGREVEIALEAGAMLMGGLVHLVVGTLALAWVLMRAPFMVPFEAACGLWRAYWSPDRVREALRVIDGLPRRNTH